jgi:hypothetical protein
MLSVCLYIPAINFWMAELIFMKFGMYTMPPEPTSTAYFINPSHHSVYVYVYPPIVARQRLGKHVTVVMYTKKTELLDASFSMGSVSYQRKIGD